MNTRNAAERNQAEPKQGLSLGTKLAGVISLLTLVLVSVTGCLFHSLQTEDLRTRLARKAMEYAQLAAQQVRSSVAFDDRETAREVFNSLALDDDVEAVALFSHTGSPIHGRGTLSALGRRANRGTADLRSFQLPDRVLVVAPVLSREGPRGTLVLEVSKRSLFATTAQTTKAAMLIGSIAWGLGLLVSWVIAASLSRRIRAVAGAARRGARGELEQAHIEDPSGDEVATLAWSFNAMVAQLRTLIDKIECRAATEQQRLEHVVEERTAALAARNADLRHLLDHVSQGFLSVTKAGTLERESSAIVTTWLGPPPKDGTLWDLVAQRSPEVAQQLELGWEQVVDDILPLELVLGQLPDRIQLAQQCLAIDYQPINGSDGALQRVLVVITDITAELEAARVELEEREVLAIFSRALGDRSGLAEFMTESRELLDSLSRLEISDPQFLRNIHTLKGNASLFGLERVAERCHEIEQTLADEHQLPPELLLELRSLWRRLEDKVGHLLGTIRDTDVQLEGDEYIEFLRAVRRQETHRELELRVLRWRGEPVRPRLQRLREQARVLAQRLGKGDVEIIVEANGLRCEAGAWGNFWHVAIHAIRNCLDHGFESTTTRRGSGNGERPQLRLTTSIQDGRFLVEIADNGRGVDWEGVRRSAERRGLPSETQKDLMDALFTDGVSTVSEPTMVSGRGVGVGALAQAVREMDGTVELFSEHGTGTRYVISWPLELMVNNVGANDNARPRAVASA